MSKKLALIPGHCLFPSHKRLKPDENTIFFMAEDYGLCTHFKYHKQKLILFLSAMRSHAEEIKKDFQLAYHQLSEEKKSTSYEDKLLKAINKERVNSIITYDLEDHFFDDRIRSFCKKNDIDLEVVDSPSFITSKSQFEDYLSDVKKPFMHTFYQRQRKDLNLLVNDQGAPFGGKWSFDAENRKSLPKGIELPERVSFSETDHTEKVKQLVNELFSDHPGETKNFNWATTRRQALSALDKFLKQRFEKFGPYEDAIKSDEAFLFHSTLSPYLNLGLITPSEVLGKVVDFYKSEETHFPSVEGFVRQVAGWREFIRGIYHNFDLNKNFLGHNRKLKSCWYDATTGIEPLDDSISKALKYGYTHHIERLMVIGNIMLLCRLDPQEVYK
jgi:deoxyribodipyrimidine photolyase-related protein